MDRKPDGCPLSMTSGVTVGRLLVLRRFSIVMPPSLDVRLPRHQFNLPSPSLSNPTKKSDGLNPIIWSQTIDRVIRRHAERSSTEPEYSPFRRTEFILSLAAAGPEGFEPSTSGNESPAPQADALIRARLRAQRDANVKQF